MYLNVFLFLKVSVFFFGTSLAIAYFLHRFIIVIHNRKLIKLFPSAFDKCFALVTDFFDIISSASKEEISRFLTQVVERKDFQLPRTFSDLQAKVIMSAYDEFKKIRSEYSNINSDTVGNIQKLIFKQYSQSYQRKVMNESFNWLLIIIPIALASALLFPLVFYFYFPGILRQWPAALSWIGLFLGGATSYMTFKDYNSKE